MVVRNTFPITPYPNGGSSSITITFELLFSFLELRFFDFYNNISTIDLLLIKDSNISTFFLPSKNYFILYSNTRKWITHILSEN